MYASYTKLFNSLVEPIFDYGSPVWGNKIPTALINIQKRAMRYFLGCGKTMPLVALTGEMGWISLQYRFNHNMLKYFLNLECGQCNKNL